METHTSLLAWRLHDRGAWCITVHRVAQSWTRLKQLSTLSLVCAEHLTRHHLTGSMQLNLGRNYPHFTDGETQA